MEDPDKLPLGCPGLEGVKKDSFSDFRPQGTHTEDESLSTPDYEPTQKKTVVVEPEGTSSVDGIIFDKRKVRPGPNQVDTGIVRDSTEDLGISKAVTLKKSHQQAATNIQNVSLKSANAPKGTSTTGALYHGEIEEIIDNINNRTRQVEKILEPTMMSSFKNLKFRSQIGRGANAVVIRAVDTVTQKQLVIKIMKQTEMGKVYLHRNEIVIPANVKHEALTKVVALRYDLETIEIVQEFAGETLFDAREQLQVWFKKNPDSFMDLVKQLFSALAVLEKHGISHCDLKPNNVCVTLENGCLRLRLIDFGSALTQQDAATPECTPEYLPPALCCSYIKNARGIERFNHRLFFDEHADSWSAGLIVQFLLMEGMHPMTYCMTEETVVSQDPMKRLSVIHQISQLCDPTPAMLTTCSSNVLTKLLEGVLSRRVENRWSAQEAFLFLESILNKDQCQEKETQLLKKPLSKVHDMHRTTQTLQPEPVSNTQTNVCSTQPKPNITQPKPNTTRGCYLVPPKLTEKEMPLNVPLMQGSSKSDDYQDCVQDNVEEDEVMALMGSRFKAPIKHSECDLQEAMPLGVTLKNPSKPLQKMQTEVANNDGYSGRVYELLGSGKDMEVDEQVLQPGHEVMPFKTGIKRSHMELEQACGNIPNMKLLLQEEEKQRVGNHMAKMNQKNNPSVDMPMNCMQLFQVVKPKAMMVSQSAAGYLQSKDIVPDLTALLDGDAIRDLGKPRLKLRAHRSVSRDTT